MIPLLINCIPNDAVVSAMPNALQSMLLFVNAVHLRMINWLLDDTPFLVVEQKIA